MLDFRILNGDIFYFAEVCDILHVEVHYFPPRYDTLEYLQNTSFSAESCDILSLFAPRVAIYMSDFFRRELRHVTAGTPGVVL